MLYIIPNGLALLFNFIDVAYYPYIRKRSTGDILFQAGGQTDLTKLLPQYLKENWLLLILLVALIWLIHKLYKRIHIPNIHYEYTRKNNFYLSALFILFSGLALLGVRGGTQRIPIDVVDAGKYVANQHIDLLLNSPFTIIKSIEKTELRPLHFNIENNESDKVYSPYHHFHDLKPTNKNLVIIILESFSKEYTGLGNRKSYTPFFDSLCKHSLVFTNAFSNGNKSIEGIPAILSSMPSLMENPFINSAYSGNYYESIASLLKKTGYQTAFFHGGINGTMNFDSYAKQAGYDAYLGRDEYNNEADFDGYWGIYDEPFLRFTVQKLNKIKEPFHAAVFTLSSHHPYPIPKKYSGKFPKGDLEIHESIGYADYSLRNFFYEASKQTWFNNSIFILCADHGSISNDSYYYNQVGHFNIPVIIYQPGENNFTGYYRYIFQQTDIMPSSLYLLGFNKPFFAFGKNFQDTAKRYVNYYSSGIHYMASDSFSFQFSNFKLESVFEYKKDSLLQENLIKQRKWDEELSYFKSFIQSYHNNLIYNTCRTK